MPTTLVAEAGLIIDPSVSEPSVPAARPAAAAVPEPELEPDGVTSRA
jgi:hypothetical protein